MGESSSLNKWKNRYDGKLFDFVTLKEYLVSFKAVS